MHGIDQGINLGRLGFLADVSADDMHVHLDEIFAGHFQEERRSLLYSSVIRNGRIVSESDALNDVVIHKWDIARMIEVDTSIDGRFLNSLRADGLIVSTPTGSTAYSLSCGGPIISPRLDAIVVVPICPHTLTDRPIVIPADQSIEVILLERDETKASITVDGHAVGEIRPDDRLTISASDKRVTLVHPPGFDFFSILRSKLFWGRDSRKRNA